MNTPAPFFKSVYAIVISVLLCGLCYYLGNGLSGDRWLLVWLAPAPIICVAVVHNKKVAFTAAFIAYVIGRLSWFWYLERLATMVPAVLFTIVPALIFAGIILLTRAVALKTKAWYAVFAFPIFFTTFEYLLCRFAPDGTASSIAYSQMNCLPFVQIASVAGLFGIAFIVTLIPSLIAFAILFWQAKRSRLYLLSIAVVMVGGVFLFGFLRLQQPVSGDKIKVGMAVMQDDLHNTTYQPDIAKDTASLRFYVSEINALAAQGVSVVLLPERALSINKITAPTVLQSLSDAAARNHVYIITGYTNLRNEQAHNSALVIDDSGHIIEDYNKVHLIAGLEGGFTPGRSPGLFPVHDIPAAVAICKDLDFQNYIREYGKSKPQLLFVPAWDFIVDDWLHARMAILRSIENGIPQVRVARIGCLTINDAYGRVTSEVSSARQPTSLTGYVVAQQVDTFYTATGDWLGVFCAVLSVALIGMLLLPFRFQTT